MIATVFDTETTGLIENPARKLDSQPEIISFSSQTIDLKTGEYFGSYNTLIKPRKPIPIDITKITNINDDTVKDAPPILWVLEDILTVLEDSSLLIGQNIRFDMDMVELECKRVNRIIKWPKTLDLIMNTIHLKGYRLSLTNLHTELFGTDFAGAHQATVDVAITCKCAIELYKRGLL